MIRTSGCDAEAFGDLAAFGGTGFSADNNSFPFAMLNSSPWRVYVNYIHTSV